MTPSASTFAVLAGLVLLATAVLLLFRLYRAALWLLSGQTKLDAKLHVLRRQGQLAEGRAYLEQLLELAPGSLPPLGGWAGSSDFLIILAEHILAHRPQTVVEFGSGATTLVAARALQLAGSGRLVTYDHDGVFADITRRRAERLGVPVDIRAVALEAAAAIGYPGKWYAMPDLPATIDFVVIDGPPKAIHPETRGGAGPATFTRLSPGGAVLLDDAGRAGERAIVARWRRDFPDIGFQFIDTDKGTVFGIRARD